MKSIPLAACSFLLGCTSLVSAQPASPSVGQQILRGCAATYKSLKEFKGGAAIISQGSINGESSLNSADAKFDFKRDAHFNITGHDTEHYPFNITSTPEKTTTTWQFRGKPTTENDEDIEMAVAG